MNEKFRSFDDLPMILDVRMVAEILHLSMTGAHTLFNREEFPSFRVGARKLITKDSFLKWIEAH